MSTDRQNVSMAVITGLMNDRSGLWLITDVRKTLIEDSLPTLSSRTLSAAREMIAAADSGERFWPTKAEYYAVIHEIKNHISVDDKETIDATIEAVSKGSKADGMSHREWVRMALAVLNKISKSK